jgi:hypothetical protein
VFVVVVDHAQLSSDSSTVCCIGSLYFILSGANGYCYAVCFYAVYSVAWFVLLYVANFVNVTYEYALKYGKKVKLFLCLTN